jgi:outer membrane protein assembly factor BamB
VRRVAVVAVALLVALPIAAALAGREPVPHGNPALAKAKPKAKPKAKAKAKKQAPKPKPKPKPTPKPVTTPSPAAPTDTAWLSYGFDDQLTNAVTSATIDAATAPNLVLRWSAPLDGWMAASPVAAPVDGKVVVYAATEGGSVTAFSADTGTQLWTQYVGALEAGGDCGTWGVSSTPAIDTSRGVLYVVGSSGQLHALDLRTGAEAEGFPVPLTVDRNLVEYVWGGLRIVGGDLFAEVASYCDVGDAQGKPADGRLIEVDLATHAISATWDPVEGPDNLAGMWGYGGISVEPDGSALYTGVGNAWVFDANGVHQDDAGYGDKLVKLDRATLDVLGANLPSGVLTHGEDEDFGAAPVLFQPKGCPPLVAMNNKQGYLYVWKRDAITDGPIWSLGVSDAASPFVGAPAWSASASTLYDAEAKEPDGSSAVLAIGITSKCIPQFGWRTSVGSGPQPPPIAVNDVVVAAGGSSGFTVLSAADGSVLYHANTASPALAPPIEVAGTIYASGGERLLAFSPKS